MKGENPTTRLKLMDGTKILADEKMPDVIEIEKGREN
jgi:hypothetical protein